MTRTRDSTHVDTVGEKCRGIVLTWASWRAHQLGIPSWTAWLATRQDGHHQYLRPWPPSGPLSCVFLSCVFLFCVFLPEEASCTGSRPGCSYPGAAVPFATGW